MADKRPPKKDDFSKKKHPKGDKPSGSQQQSGQPKQSIRPKNPQNQEKTCKEAETKKVTHPRKPKKDFTTGALLEQPNQASVHPGQQFQNVPQRKNNFQGGGQHNAAMWSAGNTQAPPQNQQFQALGEFVRPQQQVHTQQQQFQAQQHQHKQQQQFQAQQQQQFQTHKQQQHFQSHGPQHHQQQQQQFQAHGPQQNQHKQQQQGFQARGEFANQQQQQKKKKGNRQQQHAHDGRSSQNKNKNVAHGPITDASAAHKRATKYKNKLPQNSGGWSVQQSLKSGSNLGDNKKRRKPRRKNISPATAAENPISAAFEFFKNFTRSISQVIAGDESKNVDGEGCDSESWIMVESDGSESSYESSVAVAASSDGESQSIDSGVGVGKSGPLSHSQSEGIIGVFWDIENCSVPKGVSSRLIVKKVRDTFYGHRKEDVFTVACDVTNLKKEITKELNSVGVDLLHVSCEQKNAADSKLKDYLRRFMEEPKPAGSCVVLISGDSDFAGELHHLRYRHKIYVVLIHNRTVRPELCDLANEAIHFEAFVKDVVSQKREIFEPQYLLIENIPLQIAGKVFMMLRSIVVNLKGTLESKVENGCCLMKFLRKEDSKKALEYFTQNKVGLFDNPDIVITQSSERPDWKTLQESLSKAAVIEAKVETLLEPKEVEQKNDALLILQSTHEAGADFWKGFLKNIIKNDSFKDVVVKYGFIYVIFDSINSAKKAKKLFEKDQHGELKAVGTQKGSNIEEGESGGKDSKSLINKCKSVLKKKHDQTLREHSKKKKEVEDEISALTNVMNNLPSNTKPSEYQSLHSSLQLAQTKITELHKQEEVFEMFFSKNISMLDAPVKLPEDAEALVNCVKKEVSRECNLFSHALPVYAQKVEIINMVLKNPVSIILAEAGSGKSTQIVQYIYEAGLHGIGKIVCTQPRKLAVRSLAEFVSGQMGSTLGQSVGYKIGLDMKLCEGTNILFMTDQTLLNECSNESTLKDYSCIIVDEVHERSIFTDLLLGTLRKILQQRPHFKIVLTSTIIKPELFQGYFNVSNEAVLTVPGQMFPTEVVWSMKTVTPNYDYVNQCVMKAFTIHTTEEGAGHVLVFVTSAAETLKACEMFENLIHQKKNSFKALILPLHDMLSADELRKVYASAPGDTRKIIFATNFAETSLTFPGIRYVVDTGLTKEVHFDVKTQSSILKLAFVSKSSAEQRKGRAGRMQTGNCFRLYSKENFDQMADDTKPEIIRINIGQALLKLMELGIDNPCNFEFLESPPPSSFLAAMQSLSTLGAVKNDRLSEIGFKMTKIPLEPSLSKLVIRGFEEKVGYEAVIMATLASVSGAIVFRVGDKKECQNGGDFHTFVEVYKNYLRTPKAEKSQWCVTNYVDGKSMKIINDSIRDLLQICDQALGIPISTAYSSNPSVNELLQYLILDVFKLNLCIFSGHKATGYVTMKASEQIHVHPSSSIHYLEGGTPEFVVYQTKVHASKDYMLNVTPISENLLETAFSNGLYTRNTIEAMKEHVLAPVTFGPYGSKVLKKFCGTSGKKRANAEQNIAVQTNDSLVKIEVDFQKGLIVTFAKKKFHETVKDIINEQIKPSLEHVKQETEVITLDGSDKGIKYVLSLGAVISEVIMPREFISFVVLQTGPGFKTEEIVAYCNDMSQPYSYFELFKKKGKEIIVTFKQTKAAMVAAKEIPRLLNCRVEPQVSHRGNWDWPMFQLFVSWTRRRNQGLCFVSFESEEEFQAYSPKLLSCQTLEVNKVPFSFKISNKNSQELFGRGICKMANANELRKVLETVIGSDVKFEVKLPFVPGFETSEEALAMVKRLLEDVFCQYTSKEDILVEVYKCKDTAVQFKGKVYFYNARDGQITYNALNGHTTFPDTPYKLEMTVHISTTIVCHKDIFEMTQTSLKEAIETFKTATRAGDTLSIEAKLNNQDPNFVVVVLSSNNVREMEQVVARFQDILRGDTIDCLGVPLREMLFQGRNELQNVAENCGVNVHFDDIKKTISIFGPEKSRKLMKDAIFKHLFLMEKLSSKVALLHHPKQSPGLLKSMINKYSSDLEELKKSCDLFSEELDIFWTLLGSTDSPQKTEQLLDDLSGQTIEKASSEKEPCPGCLSPVTQEDMKRRLQCCGHVFCNQCIEIQIKNCSVPLVCVAENCGASFVMSDLHQLLTDETKPMVTAAALKQLVQTKGSHYRYCPTPECPMVYKVPADLAAKSLMHCHICSNQICIRCNTPYHHGVSCDVHQNMKTDKDYSVKVWLKENPASRKLCPNCHVIIERNGSCDHMTCWSCGTHMCWLCMSVFSNAQGVHDHRPSCSFR